jgi:hypothetical protein
MIVHNVCQSYNLTGFSTVNTKNFPNKQDQFLLWPEMAPYTHIHQLYVEGEGSWRQLWLKQKLTFFCVLSDVCFSSPPFQCLHWLILAQLNSTFACMIACTVHVIEIEQ